MIEKFLLKITIFRIKNAKCFFFLQYVVIPTRRSTAEAFQILIAHALGDAGSPYLIGVVSKRKKTNLVVSIL